MKILVAIPTYEGGKYCREALVASLKNFTYSQLDFLFVTNSGEQDKQDILDVAASLNPTVLVNEEHCAEGFDQVVSNRNVVRNYFLNGDWDYLYFVDHDVLSPKNIIEVLLSHKKKVCTGWYLARFNYDGTPRILPLAYIAYGEDGSRQLAIIDVLVPRLLKLTCAGLGCTLIHRSLIEKISFRRLSGTEDAAFYDDVRKKCGEDLWMDTRAACWHLKFPFGDERNNFLDPRRYKREVTKK